MKITNSTQKVLFYRERINAQKIDLDSVNQKQLHNPVHNPAGFQSDQLNLIHCPPPSIIFTSIIIIRDVRPPNAKRDSKLKPIVNFVRLILAIVFYGGGRRLLVLREQHPRGE